MWRPGVMEEKLQLSDLHRGVDYPMPCEEDADRCRIHVKMTEISMKSVEALIHSDKVRGGMGYPVRYTVYIVSTL